MNELKVVSDPERSQEKAKEKKKNRSKARPKKRSGTSSYEQAKSSPPSSRGEAVAQGAEQKRGV
jgi:hypothetical protein